MDATDGTFEIQHDFPDAVAHHYRAGGANDDVLLYGGELSYPGDEHAFQGNVRFRWRPTPRIEVQGQRTTSTTDVADLVDWMNSGGSPEMWVKPSEVLIALPDEALPDQPKEVFTACHSAGSPSHTIRDRLEQQLGEPAALEQVTFLVPNGWQALDGTGVCDPEDLVRTWHGRTQASGDGWRITLDPDGAMDSATWRELKNLGGHRFTHVGRLARLNGSTFTGEEAFAVLDRGTTRLEPGARTSHHLRLAGRMEAGSTSVGTVAERTSRHVPQREPLARRHDLLSANW